MSNRCVLQEQTSWASFSCNKQSAFGRVLFDMGLESSLPSLLCNFLSFLWYEMVVK